MQETTKVTSRYALAALTAILPYVSEFCSKLAVPCSGPITTNQVARFVPSQIDGELGGYITLTNGAEFWFEHGHINGYRTPASYYDVQDPKQVPRFFGTFKFGKDEAM